MIHRIARKLWLDAGAELGNHSYSHPDINSVALDVYTDDIVRAEPAIREALATRGKKLEFYRHPYLHTGPTPQIKKGLQDFLDARGYRVAPVTLDNAEGPDPPQWVTEAFASQR